MTTDDLTKRIAKAVEQVTCSRWEDTDDCGYCESNMVTFRHLSYMYCDAHDTITKPGDRCPHAAEVAAAVLPIITTEVRAAKAEAILMDDFDMAVADRLADAGYTECAEDEDGGVTWVSAPLGEVLHIVRICATEYETGDQT